MINNSTEDDVLILNLVKKGDKNAFRLIFDKYYVSLCRFVNMSVNDTFITEEIIQDLFVALWNRREQIEIQVTLKAYLFQAAKYRTLNYYRDNKRLLFCDEIPLEKGYEYNEIEVKELQNLIYEAILSLPEKCGEIFRLSREKNLTNAEIADLKNISVRTVENHISHALSKIKQFLGSNYTYLW